MVTRPAPTVTPTRRETVKERCSRGKEPYSYCRDRGYWSPGEPRQGGFDGTDLVVAAAVGAVVASSANASTPPPPPVAVPPTFQFINDCKDWVCK